MVVNSSSYTINDKTGIRIVQSLIRDSSIDARFCQKTLDFCSLTGHNFNYRMYL